ncbi:hypothetical protein SAY87_005233 [Trapa incisa]|uniref:Uncharacterized protein n=1 Tax=Trapa incisa TaxID=236973 RepID=A0AAN7QBD4_9MYRT|nr:hypothetical protein SAY87_005233 [Trapa incisa]
MLEDPLVSSGAGADESGPMGNVRKWCLSTGGMQGLAMAIGFKDLRKKGYI